MNKKQEAHIRRMIRDHGRIRDGRMYYADFSNMDLHEQDFVYCNLHHAKFSDANLEFANFSHANLHGAIFNGANLHGAAMNSASAERAMFIEANLTFVQFDYADLLYANLGSADASNADFHAARLANSILIHTKCLYADFSATDLNCAHVAEANFDKATFDKFTNWKYVDFENAINIPQFLLDSINDIPDGDIIGWKKLAYGEIAKLLIPADAVRSRGSGGKCRASKAVVLAVYNRHGDSVDIGISKYDTSFTYKAGKTVYPEHPFDNTPIRECTSGIHFFLTRAAAEDY